MRRSPPCAPGRGSDRHRHPGGGGRRRCDAADHRGPQPRQGRRRADHRGDQQDRPRQRRPQPGHAAAVRPRPGTRGVGRRDHHGGDLGPAKLRHRRSPGAGLLVAEVEELAANPEGRGRGIVLEANLDPGKGPVATVIVQSGTLRVSDSVVAGAAWGRVKALLDDSGDNVKEASPSIPVQLLGFDSVPSAGDEFRVTDKAKTARDIAEQREQRFRAADQRRTSSATGTGAKLEDIFEQIQRGETATLNLVLKADTQGSLEAVTESLRKLERDDVKLSFIHRAVGHQRERRDLRGRVQRHHHRLQRPPRSRCPRAGRCPRCRDPYLRDHLQAHRGHRERHGRDARSGVRGDHHRRGGGPGDLPGAAGRGHRRVLCPPRCHHPGLEGSFPSRRRRHLEGCHHVAQAVQGRRTRGARRFECGIGLSNNQDLQEGDVIETFDEREIPGPSRWNGDARGVLHTGAVPPRRAFAQGEAGRAATDPRRRPASLRGGRGRGGPSGEVAEGHRGPGRGFGIGRPRPGRRRCRRALRLVLSGGGCHVHPARWLLAGSAEMAGARHRGSAGRRRSGAAAQPAYSGRPGSTRACARSWPMPWSEWPIPTSASAC